GQQGVIADERSRQVAGLGLRGEHVGRPHQQRLLDGKAVNPAIGADYEQSLDLKTGVMTTIWKEKGVPVRIQTWLRPNRFEGVWEVQTATGHELSNTPVAKGETFGPSYSETFDAKAEGGPTLRGAFSLNGKESFAKPDAAESDIVIDGPVEDQQAVRAALHYLRTSVSGEGRMGVAPMGFSSEIYNGHIFWDADIWVFPALTLLEPERAAAIPKYRLARLAQARKNYTDWVAAGRPTGTVALGPAAIDPDAVKFPWESSVSGRETTPTSSRFEDHISGDVAFMLQQASALGIVSANEANRALRGAAAFYRDRSAAGPKGRELKGTMSPDENHTGDNDLYTNLLAQWCMANGNHPAKASFYLPRQGETFMTYDNDGMRGYKQAAAVLAVYPLQYPPAEREAKEMLARFESKVTKNGPAMTDSIHAIIRARIGDSEGAYKLWSEDWRDFSKTGLLLFSEKRNRPRTYFTTGAGGMLQSVLYGFCGLRIDKNTAPAGQWSRPLRNGYTLSCRPNLPKAWRSVTLKGVQLDGKRMNLRIGDGKVTVE
ncbi:glycoside hydrolase family 65 protein, partial [bacterium]